ncbi:hypothetical protein CDAR_96751 [Caerostris darwini]|uniref:Uncharacterized protein n=1 Tax=Caerostris darwini TaxID=1538125 RepID=A0AAV4QSM6_9ARAC|nr:hypothetical protein CDAR_96751 [Caerostris darwini]
MPLTSQLSFRREMFPQLEPFAYLDTHNLEIIPLAAIRASRVPVTNIFPGGSFRKYLASAGHSAPSPFLMRTAAGVIGNNS